MTQVQTKVADIRYRVALKQHPGIVVYKVKSSDGKDDYEVTFVDGKVNNCTCPARKPCYHMRDCQAKEDARANRARAIEDEQSMVELKAEMEQASDRRQHAALNGNRTFSLLK